MPTVRANGIDLYYEERGSGEPLILLMGLGADGSRWADHVAEYAHHYRCIMLDNRGVGRSAAPPGPYTTAMMADDTAGLMQALGIERAHISGISMGGAIGQELALRHPERVRSLTLNCTWPRCDAYTTRIFESFKALAPTADPRAFLRLIYLWIFTPAYHNAHLDDLQRREEEVMSSEVPPQPAHAFAAQCDACIAHDTLERLGAITAPTLITVGDRDIFTPLHYARALHERIQGSELVVMEGCGHAHHWERTPEFNARTLAFLQAH